MGGQLSSKKRKHAWNWSGPPGDHSPFPLDPIPYPGSDLLYCFVDIMASYHIIGNNLNLGHQAVTTNIDELIEEISDCYQEGFTLNDFVKVPVVATTTEIQDWGQKHPYQAILSKPSLVSKNSKDEKWSLHIEKCILSTKSLPFEQDFENDLICTIRGYASSGARLACAEPVGFVRSQSTNTQYGIMGVELFFNLPMHPSPVIYAYHTVTVHANYHIMPDTTQTIQQVTCDADFMGQLTVFLSKGWRLVNICIDITAIAEAYKMKVSSKSVETIWIFEKEASKIYEEEPEYEGVIIEYLHKVKKGLDNVEVPCKDWRPVIAGMGVSGWELAGIIQTPLLVQSSFTTYAMKLLMVFQRRINPSMQRLIKESCSSVPSTPAGKKKLAGSAGQSAGVFGTARRSSAGEGGASGHAYYHHTLKRYIYGDEPISNGPVMNGDAPKMKDSRSEPDVIPPEFRLNGGGWT